MEPVPAHPHRHLPLAVEELARTEEQWLEPDRLDLPALGLQLLGLADAHFKSIVLFVIADREDHGLALLVLLQPDKVDRREQAEHPLFARQIFDLWTDRRIGEVGCQIFDLLLGLIKESRLGAMFLALFQLIEAEAGREVGQRDEVLEAVVNVDAEDREQDALRDRRRAQAEQLVISGESVFDVQPRNGRCRAKILEGDDADIGVDGEAGVFDLVFELLTNWDLDALREVAPEGQQPQTLAVDWPWLGPARWRGG